MRSRASDKGGAKDMQGRGGGGGGAGRGVGMGVLCCRSIANRQVFLFMLFAARQTAKY